MKKIIKKIVVVTLACMFLLNFSSQEASAAVNEPSLSKVWNLAQKGKYTGSGTAQYSNLYSNYWFTGVSKMKYSINNLGSKTITVNVYRSDSNVSYYRGYVPAYSSLSLTMNTNSSKKYELRFSAPCNFTYSVSKGY